MTTHSSSDSHAHSTSHPRATWRAPHAPSSGHKHPLDAAARDALPDSAFALPKQRKLPLVDATHVRNAISRFDQVGDDLTDADRALAFANLQHAAKHFDVAMTETRWQDLGSRPHTPNPSQK